MSDETPKPSQYPLGEPSVLDYVKSWFHSGNGEHAAISPFVDTASLSVPSAAVQTEEAVVERVTPFPWRSLLALGLALIAQSTFEPPQPGAKPGLVIYLLSFALLGWAVYRREWTLPALASTAEGTDPLTVRFLPFLAAVLLFPLAFLLLGGSALTPGLALPDS